MNYYYDIILNFQENNCMFYDWLANDSLDFVKKIPIFQVTTKVLKDLVNNNIVVRENFLESIYNKTKLKNNTLEYAALFVSKNGAIVLEFNSSGEDILRSFLQVADECNLLEIIYTLPVTKLEYQINKHLEYDGVLRYEKDIKNFINLEINTLYNNKDWEKIVFLYNEWFLKSQNNVAEMVREMAEKLELGITDQELKIYNLIKLSYNNV